MLDLLPAVLSWTALLGLVGAALLLARGHLRLKRLADCEPASGDRLPSVSVAIPARDEERDLEAALRSVLALDYPALEVLVVNDRSTDGTGAILDRLAAAEPRLTAIHVEELPSGWLGKTHAQYVAVGQSSGEFLLFTDADVVALIGVFSVFFTLLFRPWKAPDPKSRAFIGIGAFSLVRREAYDRCGGHATVALRPDDDVKLGKVLKASGARQEMLLGKGFLSVEWYRSVRDLVRGLMKNAFAGIDYRPSLVLAGTLGQLVIFVWPIAGLFWSGGWELAANAASVALALLLFSASTRATGGRAWPGLLYPLALAIFIYIPWRSMVLALARGGIEWRGTLYPLEELKRNRV